MNNQAPISETTLQRAKFLIVDDLSARSELVERYLLLSAALHVRKVRSPLEALRVLQDPRTPIDCVICAHDFKPMTGLEFLQNIRAGRYGGKTISEIKFILMLKTRDDRVIQTANNFRISGHVVGAFDRTSLTQIVAQSLLPPQTSTQQTAASDALLLSDKPTAGKIKIAHIREQGVDLIIVPLEKTFRQKSPQAQQDIVEAVRASVGRARLQGEVVPVWEVDDGGMAFIAPKGFHPYFQSIALNFVTANLNREIDI